MMVNLDMKGMDHTEIFLKEAPLIESFLVVVTHLMEIVAHLMVTVTLLMMMIPQMVERLKKMVVKALLIELDMYPEESDPVTTRFARTSRPSMNERTFCTACINNLNVSVLCTGNMEQSLTK